jgi:hypothetical protein
LGSHTGAAAGMSARVAEAALAGMSARVAVVAVARRLCRPEEMSVEVTAGAVG